MTSLPASLPSGVCLLTYLQTTSWYGMNLASRYVPSFKVRFYWKDIWIFWIFRPIFFRPKWQISVGDLHFENSACVKFSGKFPSFAPVSMVTLPAFWPRFCVWNKPLLPKRYQFCPSGWPSIFLGRRFLDTPNACGATTVFHPAKPWTKRRSREPIQKYHQLKANFNHIFFQRGKKIPTYLIFPSIRGLVA